MPLGRRSARARCFPALFAVRSKDSESNPNPATERTRQASWKLRRGEHSVGCRQGNEVPSTRSHEDDATYSSDLLRSAVGGRG